MRLRCLFKVVVVKFKSFIVILITHLLCVVVVGIALLTVTYTANGFGCQFAIYQHQFDFYG